MVLAVDHISIADISDRLLLSDVSWQAYEAMLAEVERSGRHYKLTYDSGQMEIELPGDIHEIVKGFVRALLEAYLIDHDIDFVPLAGTTWQRRDIDKGLEADECYYIQNAHLIGSRTKLDLNHDPAPDLAIEIEATHPLLPKLPIYASMGIGEIWHIKTDGAIDVLTLDGSRYQAARGSVAVPFFTIDRIRTYIALRHDIGHTQALRRFRDEAI